MNRTVQREAVLKEVQHLKHPTADEIYIRLRKIMPQLSMGTVYRNLDDMVRTGIIKNLSVGAKQARFDYETIDHFHLRCIECGKIKNIKMQQLTVFEKMLENTVEKHKFIGYRLEFLYICKTCRKQQQEKAQKNSKPARKVLSMYD